MMGQSASQSFYTLSLLRRKRRTQQDIMQQCDISGGLHREFSSSSKHSGSGFFCCLSFFFGVVALTNGKSHHIMCTLYFVVGVLSPYCNYVKLLASLPTEGNELSSLPESFLF